MFLLFLVSGWRNFCSTDVVSLDEKLPEDLSLFCVVPRVASNKYPVFLMFARDFKLLADVFLILLSMYLRQDDHVDRTSLHYMKHGNKCPATNRHAIDYDTVKEPN